MLLRIVTVLYPTAFFYSEKYAYGIRSFSFDRLQLAEIESFDCPICRSADDCLPKLQFQLCVRNEIETDWITRDQTIRYTFSSDTFQLLTGQPKSSQMKA